MAIATSPFVLNDVSLTLILDSNTAGVPQEYMCQLNRAELVPAAASTGSEFETFCDTFTPPPKQATWTLELTGFQAWQDAADLSIFLFDNELLKAKFVLMPIATVTGELVGPLTGFSGVVTLTPGQIGGAANQYAQMTVSLSVEGKPTRAGGPPVPVGPTGPTAASASSSELVGAGLSGPE
jgi:hypothetical protein